MAQLLLTVSLSLAVGGKPEVVCRRRGRMEVGSVRRRQMAAHHQTRPSLQRQHQQHHVSLVTCHCIILQNYEEKKLKTETKG